MAGAFDVIVVGARCAGSPTAMLLARKGYKVLLVDKSTFPSDMPLSTHWVHQPSIDRLDKWGLLPNLLASGCPPIKTYTFDFGPLVLRGAPRPSGNARFSYAPRRKVLDNIVLEGAVAAGAELREGVDVQGLVWEGGTVVGIKAHARSGLNFEERGAIVIGADGMDSKVAGWVQAPSYNEQPAKQGGVWAYYSGVPLDGTELWMRPGRATFGLPTNDGQSLIVSAWGIDRFEGARHGGEKAFVEGISDIAPAFAERVSAGKRESGFVSAAVEGYYRKPFGAGWALVGDAGYKKDPCTASGITDAYREAEALSEAIDAGFRGRLPLQESLAAYEQTRNEVTMAHYQLTEDMAALEPPPEDLQKVLLACSRNPEALSQFFGVIAQTVPEQEFFAPENLSRILGGEQVPS
ncbi:MAG TPA: NAD(P)/FAD-dependent oxidoreductase [Dehalococcoidia bacterium]